ncbi:hypothetical protein DPSP01_002453 [Paraphaeosphaeria sporulosa]|uniref:Isochorismatase hydrolase n=1 Tax=Paraphaeosphaeria sporulosa TaxID=1460663 RepID=A0A177CWV3_9PLEO|nr:Isochorismatase hydrolase [Paraphaeosphaeria sporulosa]OAG11340.1 Isochorismatase hydrolase [Paraphaeosphaeria sporulosa]
MSTVPSGHITTSTDLTAERLSQNDSALLIVDHQVGLYELTRDWDPTIFRQNMIGHATLGKLFELPVVMTTSAETGPNGHLPKEILDLYPDVQVVQRKGEINAWDSPEFRAAVRATGKKQLIIGGIVTDVCTAFLALSLRSEGYSVFANVEASGTTSTLARDTANLRMQAAGVHLVSFFAILADLMRDWRNPLPGVEKIVPIINDYMPAYGYLMRGHASAILQNGTVLPGSEKYI